MLMDDKNENTALANEISALNAELDVNLVDVRNVNYFIE
jgi:hypothetical protein